MRTVDPLPQPNPVAFCRSSVLKLSRIFLGGVCVCDYSLGDGEWGVVVGLKVLRIDSRRIIHPQL